MAHGQLRGSFYSGYWFDLSLCAGSLVIDSMVIVTYVEGIYRMTKDIESTCHVNSTKYTVEKRTGERAKQ